MVHEVKNSSTSISACNRDGRKVLEKCESSEKELILKRLDISDRAISSLESISTAILPLSGAKFKRKNNETVNLKMVLDSCVLANKKMIDLNSVAVELVGLDVQIAMTEGELFILFQNLLQNSLYWLSKIKSDKKVVRVKASAKNEEKRITVLFDDNGPGIDEEYLEDIFLPGVSSKPDGTGMGLAVVAEICEKYRGSVFAGNSNSLHGSSFKLSLPLG